MLLNIDLTINYICNNIIYYKNSMPIFALYHIKSNNCFWSMVLVVKIDEKCFEKKHIHL